MGFKAVFNQDAEFSRMFAGLCGREDAALAVSFTGETESVCDTAAFVRSRKVPLVSVTNFPDSRLAGLSDIVLLTASDEKIFRLGSMSSRLAQYFVIDFLTVNLALRDIRRCKRNISSTHRAIIAGREGKRRKS